MKSTKIIIGVVIVLLAGYLLYSMAASQPPAEVPRDAASAAVQAPQLQELSVYFVNKNNFDKGVEPYEQAVSRLTTTDLDPKEATIKSFFVGLTDDEIDAGIIAFFNGVEDADVTFDVATGVARVNLRGACDAKGAAYNVGTLIDVNLKQFPDVKYIRIYDENGETLSTNELESSWPACLQP